MGKTTYLLQSEGCFGVPGGRVASFQLQPTQEIVFSNRREVDSEARVELAVAEKAHSIIEVPRMLSHPSEDITQKTTDVTEIATTGQWRSCEVCLQVK